MDMNSDDSDFDAFEDVDTFVSNVTNFLSSDSDEDDQDTTMGNTTQRHRGGQSKTQRADARKKTLALHKQLLAKDPPVSIKTKVDVVREITNKKHPLDNLGDDGLVVGFGLDAQDKLIRVSLNMVLAALAEKNNHEGKGPSICTHGAEGRTEGYVNASKSSMHLTGRCRHNGCKHIIQATAQLEHHGNDTSNAAHAQHWTVDKFHDHTCTEPATKSKGRSNCAFDATQMAFAIQNDPAILAAKNTKTIKNAMSGYTSVKVAASYIANVKTQLIIYHEGSLSENIKKLPALLERIRERGHEIDLCLENYSGMRAIIYRNAAVAWKREMKKLDEEERVKFDYKKVDISSIEKGRTYVVGFTLQHGGFAQMRRNGCTRLQSTDASHMKSLLGGTCFGT